MPRQEGEYEIVGPELAQVPDNATIAFFLCCGDTAARAAAAGKAEDILITLVEVTKVPSKLFDGVI